MLTSRLAICLSFLFCVSATLSAQDPKIFDGPKLSPVISAATPGDRVRFSSPSAGIAQMRVRIVYASGDVLFDSAWKDGNVLDWPIEAQGQPLTSGSYRCIVMVKDLAGQVTQKESTLIAQGGQVSFEHRAGTDGLTIVGVDEGTPKITVLVHDGDNGAIVSTSGGLSFRFGNFLAGKDREAMRLTADGSLGIGTDKPQAPLDVNGFIRTSKGIMFPDGSILTTAGAQAATGTGAVNRLSPNAPGSTTSGPILGLQTGASPRRPTPRGDFTPLLPQFVVDDNGVHIGNPSTSTYGLAVAGDVNLFHNLALPLTTPTTGVITLAGSPFAHAYGGNTFVGPNAGNLTMNTLLADANTAVGNHAFFGNVSGNFNTATGANALYSNSTGGANTGIGYGALNTNNADYNTAFGYNSLFANVSGSENTAVGRSALEHSTSSNNTAVGSSALNSVTSGVNNTAVGFNALAFSHGNYNTAIGQNAGDLLVVGSSNIYIGNEGVDVDNNTIRIGTECNTIGCPGQQFVTFIAGAHQAVTGVPLLISSSGQLGVATSSRRYKFDIADMAGATSDLMRLRPVTFRYLAHGDNAPLQYGLIAEEVAEVYPELVTRNKDGEVETVMYQFLAPMLLNEVQKQHRQIEEQQKTINALKDKEKAIDALNATLHQLGLRLQALERQVASSK